MRTCSSGVPVQASAKDARLAKLVVELAKRQIHFEPDIAEIIAEEWDRLFDDDAAIQSSAGAGSGTIQPSRKK